MKRTPEQLSKWSAPPSFGNTVAFVCAILGLLALTSSCDGFLTNDQADREFPPDPKSWELAFVDSLYPVSYSSSGDLLNIHDGLIFKSSDQGRSWTIIQPQIPDGWNNLVGPIVVLPSGDILAELGGQHPFPFHDPYAALARSVNGGDSFEVIATDFLGSDNVWQDLVNFDIGLLSDLYLAVYNPRVGSDLTIYRSTDEGDSWVDTGLQVRYRIPTVHIAEEIGTYWTTVEKTVYHSSNWGISWQSVTDHPWEDVVDLGVSGNGRVFVVGYNSTGSSSGDYILSLYFSNDKGATWSRVDGFSFEQSVTEVLVINNSQQCAIVEEAGRRSIFCTADSMKSWHRQNDGLPVSITGDASERLIRLEKDANGYLYIGSSIYHYRTQQPVGRD